MTGKSYGSATITITTHNNRTIKFSVSVSNALTASKMPKLTLLAPADGKIGSGMSGEIKITFPKQHYAQYDLYVNDALVTFDLSKRRCSYNSKQQVVTDTVPFTANDVSEAAVAHIRLVPSNNAALEAALDVQLLPAPSDNLCQTVTDADRQGTDGREGGRRVSGGHGVRFQIRGRFRQQHRHQRNYR